MTCKSHIFLILVLSFSLYGCTVNPFRPEATEFTGTATGTVIGAGAGAGLGYLLGGSKGIVGLTTLGGAAAGYYVSTLRFASGGIIQNCGQVFTLGDYTTIDIPSDRLFDVNTADFSEDAGGILHSVVAVLNRYPSSNIIISGNTSGFGPAKWERHLSEARASQVAAYLWAHGINSFQQNGMRFRKLTYVGYGNYFPIANNIQSCSIRQNSHVQITVYPTCDQLKIDKKSRTFNNVGAVDEPDICQKNISANTDNEFHEIIQEPPTQNCEDEECNSCMPQSVEGEM